MINYIMKQTSHVEILLKFFDNITKLNLDLLFKKIIIVRTSFDLDPTQEWIQAHVAQTMNL